LHLKKIGDRFVKTVGPQMIAAISIDELNVAHSLGKVERAYRRETGVQARRVAMQRYADWLTDENANVIGFPVRT
jgi:hypothetical protein